jgi:hypothetical protein
MGEGGLMRRHLQAARHANVAPVELEGRVKAERIEEALAARLWQQILHFHAHLAFGRSRKLLCRVGPVALSPGAAPRD